MNRSAARLVGMTQGARKRAVRRMVREQVQSPSVVGTIRVLLPGRTPLDSRPPTSEDVRAALADPRRPPWLDPSDPDGAAEVLSKASLLNLRARYRVGERLRPCPGCSRCAQILMSVERSNACMTLWTVEAEGRTCAKVHERVVSVPRFIVQFEGQWIGCKEQRQVERTLRSLLGVRKAKIGSVGADECDGSGVLPARRAHA